MPSTKTSERVFSNEITASKGVHWHIPAMMIGAMLAGVVFATCHHLFYQSLNGRPVSDTTFLGLPVSDQEANLAIGTAFAFLVKACLVFAIGVAFIQVFWSVSHTFSTTRAPKLGWLDSTYGARQNLWTFLNLVLWWKYPLLLALALTTWLVPIAAILTPSTLSIRSAAITPPLTSVVNVPTIDFRNVNFLTLMEANADDSYYIYAGPSPAVSRVTNAVLAIGDILPFQAPGVNASWELDFSGPSLKCDHVTGETLKSIRQNIHNSTSYGLTYFASWFPGSEGNQSNLLPFPQHGISGFSKGSLVPSNNVDLAFYMASMPPTGQFPPTEEELSSMYGMENFTLIQCRLLNSTYKTSFNFTNGTPNITTQITYLNAGQALQSIKSTPTNQLFFSGSSQDHCSASSRTCIFHRDFFQTLSYQAVMDAFSSQISGLVSWQRGDTDLTVTSNLPNTILDETSAAIKLRTEQIEITSESLQWLLGAQGINIPQLRGLFKAYGALVTLDIPEAVEQLFRNVTVSMMTSAALQPNASSITAPGPVNVTYHRYHNVYVYSAWKLWIPYSIAIGLTLLVVLIGLWTMFDTDATYTDSFSTVFRAARSAKLSETVRDEDQDGRYPLPEYLESTRVWLPGYIMTVKSTAFARYNRLSSLDVQLDDVFPQNRVAMDSRLLVPSKSNGSSSSYHHGSSQSTRLNRSRYPDGLTDRI